MRHTKKKNTPLHRRAPTAVPSRGSRTISTSWLELSMRALAHSPSVAPGVFHTDQPWLAVLVGRVLPVSMMFSSRQSDADDQNSVS